jgi:hypothetical protein
MLSSQIQMSFTSLCEACRRTGVVRGFSRQQCDARLPPTAMDGRLWLSDFNFPMFLRRPNPRRRRTDAPALLDKTRHTLIAIHFGPPRRQPVRERRGAPFTSPRDPRLRVPVQHHHGPSHLLGHLEVPLR